MSLSSNTIPIGRREITTTEQTGFFFSAASFQPADYPRSRRPSYCFSF